MLDDAENLSEEIWDKTMAVNLKAPFMLSQIIGREMIKQKKRKNYQHCFSGGIDRP